MGLFILSAVSGTGKSTIANALLRRATEWRVSVSHTTRQPRGVEEDGVHYHFRNRSAFEAMIANRELVEWAAYIGQYYGTAVSNVEKAMRDGADLIFDIEINGARQIKVAYPEAHGIFILPPSFDVLKNRLLGRATDDLDKVYRRLRRGLAELDAATTFDHLIVNNELDEAVRAIERIRDGALSELPDHRQLRKQIRDDMAMYLESNGVLESPA